MRIWPRTLAGQLVAGILAALVVAQLATFAIFVDERRMAARAAARTQVLQRSAAVFRLLENTPAALASRIAGESSDEWIRFTVSDAAAVGADGARPRDWALRRSFQRYLGRDNVEIRMDVDTAGGLVDRMPPMPFRWGRDGDEYERRDDDRREQPRKRRLRPAFGLTLSIGMQDGRWMNVETLVTPPPPSWAVPTLSMVGGTAVVLVIIVIVLVRRVTRPLAQLASAAESLGRGADTAPLAEEGPLDIRRTTEAFNRMQERLQRFVRDRTQMLAAISHDLRTPITSIRLRAEFIEDAELRDRIIATLAEMQRMTEATLAFAREDVTAEPSRIVDIAALVDSVAADLADTGMDIACDPAERIDITGRPDALKRVFRNLIENAVAYGQRARVAISTSQGDAIITIEDDGPGIPEAARERVFEPFVRLEESRNRETGGIGLGLAIARTIVRAHGGDIALDNAAGGGLRVTVTLPLDIPA
ncbi:MAG: ATP-binding protein [Alphaproteobacteria bacterium]